MITNEVVNQAISYIMKHIGETITIEDVAESCHFSKYYFSRIFKEETGESMYAFIKRVRLEQSAFRLKVERDRTITAIGWDYGYSSSNYSSVFKKHHRYSPVGFRRTISKRSARHPYLSNQLIQMESFEACNEKISIQTMADQNVIYERRIGNYGNLAEDWNLFLEKYKCYVTEDTLMLERTFDDPSITDTDKCLYDICITVDENCDLKNTYTIPGGKFAVYHFKGFPQDIYGAYQNIFNIWMPRCQYKIDKRYGFERYREVDCETMYMELDLFIPIE